MQMLNRGGGDSIRIIIGVVIAIFSLISYFASSEFNPITGEQQYLSMTPNQEISLGLQSVPTLIQEYGGLYQDDDIQRAIDEIGMGLVNNSFARDTQWRFEFYVLDSDEVNAFALPGGPVFITAGLLGRLETEDQVAGVLAHEIVHVLARHSAQQIAQNDLANGLVGAIGVASGDASAAQTAAMVAQLINMSYGRDDEIQSDTLGVCILISAGYDPNGMAEVMRILEAASGGGRQPEFFSSHPNPDNRIQRIQSMIENADRDCP